MTTKPKRTCNRKPNSVPRSDKGIKRGPQHNPHDPSICKCGAKLHINQRTGKFWPDCYKCRQLACPWLSPLPKIEPKPVKKVEPAPTPEPTMADFIDIIMVLCDKIDVLEAWKNKVCKA